jgi:general stress protein CsbA
MILLSKIQRNRLIAELYAVIKITQNILKQYLHLTILISFLFGMKIKL